MLGIGWSKKRALVMVKPPGDARRAGILEIDDDIFIAVEHPLFKRLPRAVGHPREMEFRARRDALAEEAAKHRRRRRPIEAPVVKAQTNLDWTGHFGGSLPVLIQPRHRLQ